MRWPTEKNENNDSAVGRHCPILFQGRIFSYLICRLRSNATHERARTTAYNGGGRPRGPARPAPRPGGASRGAARYHHRVPRDHCPRKQCPRKGRGRRGWSGEAAGDDLCALGHGVHTRAGSALCVIFPPPVPCMPVHQVLCSLLLPMANVSAVDCVLCSVRDVMCSLLN
jgi:hypothetical protein